MEALVGYKLIETKTGKVVDQWGGEWGSAPSIPNPLRLPSGDCVLSPTLNIDYQGTMLTEWFMEKPSPTKEEVNVERDRRIETSFPFMGKQIQFRPGDRENINGASSLAIIAIMNGAQRGDTKWHGGKEDFVWITADNSLLTLDAFQTIEMGKAAAEWKSKNIFAARELKNQSPIPEDFADDKYWPSEKEVVVQDENVSQ